MPNSELCHISIQQSPAFLIADRGAPIGFILVSRQPRRGGFGTSNVPLQGWTRSDVWKSDAASISFRLCSGTIEFTSERVTRTAPPALMHRTLSETLGSPLPCTASAIWRGGPADRSRTGISILCGWRIQMSPPSRCSIRYVAKLQITCTCGTAEDVALNDMPATDGFWIDPVLTASLSLSLSSTELAPAVPRRSSSSPPSPYAGAKGCR